MRLLKRNEFLNLLIYLVFHFLLRSALFENDTCVVSRSSYDLSPKFRRDHALNIESQRVISDEITKMKYCNGYKAVLAKDLKGCNASFLQSLPVPMQQCIIQQLAQHRVDNEETFYPIFMKSLYVALLRNEVTQEVARLNRLRSTLVMVQDSIKREYGKEIYELDNHYQRIITSAIAGLVDCLIPGNVS